MNPKLDSELERWLRAEARGRAEEAERRLAAAFRIRGADGPRQGFAARTMEALERRAHRARAARLQHTSAPSLLDWAFKIGVTASVLLAGVSAILLSGMFAAFARIGGGKQVVGWGIELLASASEQVARSIALWNGLDRGAEAMASAMLGPQSLAAVTAALLVSLFAFRWLSRLMVFERSATHV